MKVSELRDIAEYFAVDLDGNTKASKPVILAALEEDGVSYEMYEKFLNSEKAEAEVELPKPKKKPSADATLVLVRMDRENPRYEVNGYVFTKDHPFVAMTEDDAEFIFTTQQGFRMATPREIQEYYN
jgi:hypothetical protein